MFSPMSSFIFYPGIDAIANGLHVTVGLVNIAITTYMVASGIIPALLGSAADAIGRRPIYLLAMLLYLAANLGLSLQNSYGGLLALRMLQSAGSSGVCNDTAPPRPPFPATAKTLNFPRNYIAGVRCHIRHYNTSRARLICRRAFIGVRRVGPSRVGVLALTQFTGQT
jgi:MFS family permease